MARQAMTSPFTAFPHALWIIQPYNAGIHPSAQPVMTPQGQSRRPTADTHGSPNEPARQRCRPRTGPVTCNAQALSKSGRSDARLYIAALNMTAAAKGGNADQL